VIFSRRIAALATIMFFAYGVQAGGGSFSVVMIPDAGATQVSVQEKAPLKSYLTRAMGRDVNLVILTSYNATIEALRNGSTTLQTFRRNERRLI
jgi:ABC-type phosphate/phosphonate transport system substrate-binding protein